MRGVVTCPEYLAPFAGAEILAADGNAVDAAIATAFAQGVVAPKLSGVGGMGVMIVYNASNQSAECIRFWGVAGSKASPNEFTNDLVLHPDGSVGGVRDYRNAVGYASISVPGFVRGMHQAFLRYGSGRVRWASLLEPAIRLARDGFAVDDYLYQYWRPDTSVEDICPPYMTLTATPAAAAIYTRSGDVLHPGEHLVQRDYALTLSRLAAEGPEIFYQGDLGMKMALDVEQHGGLFTRQDLLRYRPMVSEPLRGRYRGHEILSDPPPGSGALVVETFNILEALDLVGLGWNNPEYLDVLARVFRHIFSDRRRFMADPRYVHVPVDMLTSQEYARRARGALFASSKAQVSGLGSGHEGSTHVTAMDGTGNAVAITHTVCDASGVVTEGLGFMYNNDMSSFDPRPGQPNSIAPGKSPINGGAPTILLKDGQVMLAIGSPAGPRKVTAIVQAILNVVDFGMDVEQAIAADRIHREEGPIMVEPTFPKELAEELRRRGYDIRITGYTARVAAVYRETLSGELIGASDPRSGRGKAVVE